MAGKTLPDREVNNNNDIRRTCRIDNINDLMLNRKKK